MPWCEHCQRYLTPSTVRPDCSCPWCGRFVDPGRLAAAVRDEPAPDDEPLPPVPWHLKLLGAALVVYLGYRAYQGIEWVARHV